MYDLGKGAGPAVAGVVVLPNTGGNRVLMVAAITSIAVGVAIIATTVLRKVAKTTTK